MPCCDFGGHHDEFIDDEGRVGDAYHAGETGRVCAAGEELGEELDGGALVEGYCDPDKKGAVGEARRGGELGV